MSRFAQACLFAGLIAAGAAHAQEPAVADDPYQWLEDVTGDKPLDWVRAQNAKTDAALASTPEFKAMEAGIREVLDSDAKIPGVQKIGDWYYNFWKDRNHERGIWRRTTLEEYRKPNPAWETIIDLDALNKAEGENWVWHGADCLRPDYNRCLVALSRGGADADVTREFDVASKRWVEGGFFRPEAKGALGWIDRDTVYVYTDFGAGTMTESGYPRVVKRWKRGTPLESAQVVYEGKADDMYIAAYHDDTPGFERDFVSRTLAFYNDELYLVGKDGKLAKVDAPNSANKGVKRQWLTLELREPWTVGGKTYPAGSLLATDFDGFMAGKREFDVLFEPTDSTSLASYSWTKSHLVLNVLDDVKNRLSVLTPTAQGWKRGEFVGAPAFGTLGVSAVDDDESDAVWLTATDYLTPTTLSLVQLGKAPEQLKAMPSFFDGSNDVIEQHFATSRDGTRVPYFLVRPKGLKADGSNPTLLYGYGGFEIALTPGYSGGLGRSWLDRGEILVGLVAVRLQRGLVPARAVLAAAADIGQRVYATLLQPGLADAAGIAGRHRNLETAIAVQQGRCLAIERQRLRADQEVRHLGAILRGREVLLDDRLAAIEEHRVGLQHFRLLAQVGDRQRGRGQEIGGGQPHRVAVLVVHRTHADGADRRRADEIALRPRAVARGQH